MVPSVPEELAVQVYYCSYLFVDYPVDQESGSLIRPLRSFLSPAGSRSLVPRLDSQQVRPFSRRFLR